MDLTSAGGQNINLIDGNFNISNYLNIGAGSCCMAQVFPVAKIGAGNYFYVYSGGTTGLDNINYFGMSIVTYIYGGGAIVSNPGLTVQQAYAIDKTIDDGLPQSGRITATYYTAAISQNSYWAAGGGAAGASDTSATSGSSTTCYDNSASAGGTPGISGAIQHYSLEMSSGTGVNCALSFRMQAGD